MGHRDRRISQQSFQLSGGGRDVRSDHDHAGQPRWQLVAGKGHDRRESCPSPDVRGRRAPDDLQALPLREQRAARHDLDVSFVRSISGEDTRRRQCQQGVPDAAGPLRPDAVERDDAHRARLRPKARP